MASLRQIRERLRSIQSTKQIMRAMQLVSASKLKRTQNRLSQARSVLEFLDGLLQRVLATMPEISHPLCAVRTGKTSEAAIITSDAGLCGSYNTNLIQMAEGAEINGKLIHQPEGQVPLLEQTTRIDEKAAASGE